MTIYKGWEITISSFRDPDNRLWWDWRAIRRSDGRTMSGCCFDTPDGAMKEAEHAVDEAIKEEEK